MTVYFLLFIAGLLGGVLAGVTGVGTGFIMIMVIPITLRFLGIPEELIIRLTIANTIFATMCASLSNNIQLIAKGNFYWKETLTIALCAAASASLFLIYVVYKPGYTSEIYNIIIIILMIYIIIRTLSKLRKSLVDQEQINPFKLTISGFFGGTVAALTGLGGGSIVIPMLNLWMKVDIKKAKTISYGSIFIIALVLTTLNIYNQPIIPITQWHIGHIIIPIALPLVLGVLVGSPIGLRIGDKFSAKTISYIFLAIITIVMVKKILELILS